MPNVAGVPGTTNPAFAIVQVPDWPVAPAPGPPLFKNDVDTGQANGTAISTANSAQSGVAFDAATAGAGLTFTHTCTGVSRYLVVGVVVVGTTVRVASVTSAGTQMGFIRRAVGVNAVELWGLIAPATGANSVVITLTSATGTSQGAVSFTGANQLAQNGPSIDGFGTSNLLTAGTITAPAGSMLVSAAGAGAGITVGDGAVEAWNDGGGDGQSYTQIGGGEPQNLTWTTSTNPNWIMAVCSVLPAPMDKAFTVFGAAAPKYDNTHGHSGPFGMFIDAPNGLTTTISAGWDGGGNPYTIAVYTRFYLYMTSIPTQALQLMRFTDANLTLVGGIRLTATGTLICLKATNATVGSASTAIPLNQWVRIEARCRPTLAATTGEIELRAWWTSPESSDPATADATLLNQNVNFLGSDNIDGARYGICANPTALTAPWQAWIDDIATNSYGWIGPAPPTTNRSTVMVVGQAQQTAVW